MEEHIIEVHLVVGANNDADVNIGSLKEITTVNDYLALKVLTRFGNGEIKKLPLFCGRAFSRDVEFELAILGGDNG